MLTLALLVLVVVVVVLVVGKHTAIEKRIAREIAIVTAQATNDFRNLSRYIDDVESAAHKRISALASRLPAVEPIAAAAPEATVEIPKMDGLTR